VGELHQIPPAFSAKKVDGERAYARARRGDDVDLKPVLVHVGAADLLEASGAYARVRFVCSRGTYVRALARDLGRSVGIGAHLVALRRTRSGSAYLEQAIRLEDLNPVSLARGLVPMISILSAWPSVVASPREAADLRMGRAITLDRAGESSRTRVRVADASGDLLALASLEGSRVQPFCVF
jgi:tRNA pseudouridine55 synthase